MGSDAVKVAIIGCGAISEIFYAPALKELARKGLIEVCALVDSSAERLGAISADFPASERVAEIARIDRKIDLAIVATPARFHARHTVELLRKGIHVLCEKPMAADVGECESMIDAARVSGRLLAVGLFRRFYPAAQQIREIVSGDVLGKVTAFSIHEGTRFQWRAKSDSFFRKASAGGGVLIDIGVHALDLLLWWFGEPAQIDYEDDAMGGVEANCKLAIRYGQGFTGIVRLSRDWNLQSRYLITFERGWLSWNPGNASQIELGLSPRFALRAGVHDCVERMGQPDLGDEGFTYAQSFIAQIENIAYSVLDRDRLRVPGEEGLRSMKLIESCYRKRRLAPMTWMGEGQLDAARRLGC